MRSIQTMKAKLNDRGLSIVELICAIAIVSLLGTVISSIMVVSANSYRRGSAETEVQQEAQLVANQISDLIIDSTSSVAYDASAKELTVVNGSYTSTIRYDDTNNKLYYSDTANTGEDLMAEGVTSFNVETSHFSKYGYIQMDMTVESGNNSYPAVFTITSRNANDPNATYNPNAQIKVTTLIKKWLLEPNQEKDFNGLASSSNGAAITWSVTGNTDPDTQFTGSVLKIGKNETAVSVQAVASVGSSTGSVTVFIRRVKTLNLSASLTSGSSLQSGAKYKLTSVINGSALNQISGAQYDTDYVETRNVYYDITAYSTEEAKQKVNLNKFTGVITLNDNIVGGDSITITAYALHAYGKNSAGTNTNKTGIPYAEVFGTYVLRANGPLIIPDTNDGWVRMTESSQASTTNAMLDAYINELIAAGKIPEGAKYNHGVLFRYTAKYREIVEEDGALVDGPWIYPSMVQAEGGLEVNIRSLISGSMTNYNADYEIYIDFILYNQNDPDEVYDTFTFGSTVKHVMAGFTSNYYSTTAMQYGWSASNAPNLYYAKNQQVLVIDGTSVTGIPSGNQNRLYNELRFVTQKKQSDGTWATLTGNTFQNQNGCAMMDQNYNWTNGEYRILVTAKLPKIVLNERDNKAEMTGEILDVKLYRESDGTGIYYFKIDSGASPTPTATATPTPTATATPTPTATATASPEATATASPEATATASPTATATTTTGNGGTATITKRDSTNQYDPRLHLTISLDQATMDYVNNSNGANIKFEVTFNLPICNGSKTFSDNYYVSKGTSSFTPYNSVQVFLPNLDNYEIVDVKVTHD